MKNLTSHALRHIGRHTMGSALTALALAAGLGWQPAAQAAAEPLAVAQIVERNVEARGGLAAWRAVQTLSMSGVLDAGRVNADPRSQIEGAHGAPGQPRKRLHPEALPGAVAQPASVIRLPYLVEMKRPRQMRVELQVKDTTAVQVYDGTQGWKLRPYLGRHEVESFSAEELKLAARQQELDGPLIDHAAKGTTVEADGIESVDGHEAYKLRLTLKTGDVIHVWVDAQTFLDIKMEAPRRYAGKERSVVTFLRDYRQVDGLMLPFELEDRVDGARGAEKIDIQQVAVNAPLASSRFTRPQ